MSLGDLALIVAAGLAGPLLAASRRAFVPVVITPALGAAVTTAALATLGLCALGTGPLASRTDAVAVAA